MKILNRIVALVRRLVKARNLHAMLANVKAGIASLGPKNHHLGPHNVSFKTSMNFVTAYQGHTGHAGHNFHV